MATVHVTTADQFLTAVTVEGDTIIIDNDLDFNGITVNATIYCNEIDGGGHNLYNIQSTTTDSPIFFVRACNMHNVAFVNVLQTQTAGFLNCLGDGATVDRCTFSGYFGRVAGGNITLSKCGINASRFLGNVVAANSTYVPKLYDCYIHADRYSGTIAGSAANRVEMQNCYFSGLVANPNNNAVMFNTRNMQNCVFNVDITASESRTITLVDAVNAIGVSLCNSDKISSNITCTYGVTPLTDAQLKTPADVRATGFPLIG